MIRRSPSTSSVSLGSAARLVWWRARSSRCPTVGQRRHVLPLAPRRAPRRRRRGRTRRRAAPWPRAPPSASGRPRTMPATAASTCSGANGRAAARDRDAGGEALHVPLPRRRERLVEVVHVEHEVAFRGREHAEVEQVGVAARLDPEPAGRRGREVVGHDLGRAAEERERRHQHPPDPDRHEVAHARAVAFLEQRDRIGPVGRRAASPRATTAGRRRAAPGLRPGVPRSSSAPARRVPVPWRRPGHS